MPGSGASTIAAIDAGGAEACATALAPLFEGAPRFLARLCAERPFRDAVTLFAVARRVAQAMPEPEQVELLDAHPRLGASPASVSALSYVEQGYERDAADRAVAAADSEGRRIAAELDRLNAAYERRFGFRYCVFVAGRSRGELLPGFETALRAERGTELTRALEAVVDIAADRWARLESASIPR